ncbi:MAG: MFS transporter, partial [Acidobacteriaceae bacterium]
DKKGRKFLFMVGTGGVILSMLGVGLIFLKTEARNLNCTPAIQSLIQPNQTLTLRFDPAEAQRLLAENGNAGRKINAGRASLEVIYSYGDFTAATNFVRSDDKSAAPIQINRANAVPTGKVEAFFKNPFANLKVARTAPLRIQKAYIGTVPETGHGWLVAIGLYLFMTFYSLGPGVCVWIALTELMPTRIRSNGMSIALVLNQLVATVLAAVFLPVVGKHGYSTMFFLFAGCTVCYFLVVTLFLPETKGKTLEEIEEYFENSGRKKKLAV